MKTTKLISLAAAAVLAAALDAAPARAQGTANEAAAVALFNEAQKLAAAGDYAAACPKFVEVRRTLPTAGLFLNLGDCYEHLGKLASAWGAFKEAERIARNGRDADRQGEAARRAEMIEGKLSRLTITVGAAERLPGLTVKRDDTAIGEGQWGSAVPVDAGEHVVAVSAPRHRSWLTTITVPPNGAAISVAVPRLVPDAVLVAPPSTSASWWSGQRIAGAAVGGAGVIGLIVGGVFGAQTLAKMNDSKAQCAPSDPTFCNDAGVALRQDAKTAGTVSTAAFVAGGLLVAGGVVLMVTAPARKAAPAPATTVGLTAGNGTFGLMLGRVW